MSYENQSNQLEMIDGSVFNLSQGGNSFKLITQINRQNQVNTILIEKINQLISANNLVSKQLIDIENSQLNLKSQLDRVEENFRNACEEIQLDVDNLQLAIDDKYEVPISQEKELDLIKSEYSAKAKALEELVLIKANQLAEGNEELILAQTEVVRGKFQEIKENIRDELAGISNSYEELLLEIKEEYQLKDRVAKVELSNKVDEVEQMYCARQNKLNSIYSVLSSRLIRLEGYLKLLAKKELNNKYSTEIATEIAIDDILNLSELENYLDSGITHFNSFLNDKYNPN